MNEPTRHDTIDTEKPHCKELPRRNSSLRRSQFLLRMWCVDETGRSNWRASLEMPDTGKRIGFASLEGLFVYLSDFSERRNDDQDEQNKE